ncbi:MAG: PH domain-containing protein [Deltaproteobacteria bacterium]|nr:PH domain-containing protein [Deltaproteobacteria bacterium]
MEPSSIHAITRPHPRLLRQYLLQALFAGPVSPIAMLILYFRYHTMRYRFDEHGISKSWGILLRREVNLTYARIQDIHLASGPIQRWLGLADVQVQTASGSASAELVIEGLLEFEAIRDFLYSRMRGVRDEAAHEKPDEAVTLLREIRDDLRATREALAPKGTA